MGFEQNSTEFALVFLPALTHSTLYTDARGLSVSSEIKGRDGLDLNFGCHWDRSKSTDSEDQSLGPLNLTFILVGVLLTRIEIQMGNLEAEDNELFVGHLSWN